MMVKIGCVSFYYYCLGCWDLGCCDLGCWDFFGILFGEKKIGKMKREIVIKFYGKRILGENVA